MDDILIYKKIKDMNLSSTMLIFSELLYSHVCYFAETFTIDDLILMKRDRHEFFEKKLLPNILEQEQQIQKVRNIYKVNNNNILLSNDKKVVSQNSSLEPNY